MFKRCLGNQLGLGLLLAFLAGCSNNSRAEPIVSADGHMLAVLRDGKGLYLGPVGHLTRVSKKTFTGGAWSPDDSMLAVSTATGSWVYSLESGDWKSLPDMGSPFVWSSDSKSLTGLTQSSLGKDFAERYWLRTYNLGEGRVSSELEIPTSLKQSPVQAGPNGFVWQGTDGVLRISNPSRTVRLAHSSNILGYKWDADDARVQWLEGVIDEKYFKKGKANANAKPPIFLLESCDALGDHRMARLLDSRRLTPFKGSRLPFILEMLASSNSKNNAFVVISNKSAKSDNDYKLQIVYTDHQGHVINTKLIPPEVLFDAHNISEDGHLLAWSDSEVTHTMVLR